MEGGGGCYVLGGLRGGVGFGIGIVVIVGGRHGGLILYCLLFTKRKSL